MDQLKRLFGSLSPRQRLAIVVAMALAGAGLFGLTRWKRNTDFRPLYTGMSQEDAGAVVGKIREKGAEYRLSEDGASVLVPSARVAELRLDLAAAGLPRSGRIGFELFDKMNFGATEFVEHINYRRALEGELERSLAALAEVEAARVHLTFPKESLYVEERRPAKASVMLRLRPQARLAAQSVAAVCHLVASAVEGLAPEAVSVLDMQGRLLNRARRPASGGGAEASGEALEYQAQVERSLAAKIHATLEPLLGPDRFRAGVSVDCDFTSGEQSEENFDPSKSVMVTSQKSEDFAAAGTAAGLPGTASNLPRPAPRATGADGATRRTENITYQSSRTVKRVKLPQGAIKRMSITVLVDRRAPAVAQPETLKTIRDLVAGVTGWNAGRGDQLIVESLPFENGVPDERPQAPQPAPAAPSPAGRWPQPQWWWAAFLLLPLVALPVWLMRRRRRRAVSAETAPALPAPREAAAAAPQLAAGPPQVENGVERLRLSARDNPALVAGALRTWIRTPETP